MTFCRFEKVCSPDLIANETYIKFDLRLTVIHNPIPLRKNWPPMASSLNAAHLLFIAAADPLKLR